MSDRDDDRLTCDDVRSLAFDARASDDREAEVNGERRAAFDRHLEECSTCRAYVGRIDGMLGSAAEADPADWASEDADETFDAVMDRLERDAGDDDGPADGGAAVEFWPRRYYAAAGLAAGILLTVAGFFAWRSAGTGADAGGPAPPTQTRTSEAGEEGSEPTSDEESTSDSDPGDGPGLDRLAAAEEDARDLEVYASPEATWAITDRDPVTVRLDAGTILVEYLPSGAEKMRVRTRDAEIRVTGTVFYVASDGAWTSTGVAEGSVEVDVPERDSPIGVETGQRLGSDYQIASMSDREREAIETHVDLERHRAELASVRSGDGEDAGGVEESSEPKGKGEAAAPGRPSGNRATDEDPSERRGEEPAPEKTKSSEIGARDEREGPDLPARVAELRRQARAAMERKDFEAAARKYEAMLDRLPEGHAAVPSVHLDVARVYLRYLERPAAAADHLRTFVTRWPDDPAAESARGELCRIAADRGRDESMCDGGAGGGRQ